MKVLMLNGSPKAKGNTALALAEMEKIRLPLYQASANFIVENDGPLNRAIQRVGEGFCEVAGH